jgi:hypothetical protein
MLGRLSGRGPSGVRHFFLLLSTQPRSEGFPGVPALCPTGLRLSCYHAPGAGIVAKRGEKMEIKGRELADPGGRYAVETATSTFGRLAQELAQVLNEGDARGWRVLHIHGFGADYDYAFGSTTPVPLCVVWDKQGRESQ